MTAPVASRPQHAAANGTVATDPGPRAIARLLAGMPCETVDASTLQEPWSGLAEIVVHANGTGRLAAFEQALADRPDAAAIRQEVFAVNPDGAADRSESAVMRESDATYEVPALPAAAVLDRELGAGACPWLDAYIDFSRRWSPNAYPGFHEAVGVWVLSAIAARRIVLPWGGRQYTPLFVALTARSSLYAKTTTADIGVDLIRELGLGWLLASDTATPAKFISDLAGHVPEAFEDLPPADREREQLRLAFAGQRGWFYEEFGQHLNAMMRADGTMADFRGLLRRLDDCKATYEYGTIARGTEVINRPYVALLANLTPADMKPHAKRGAALWSDGILARIALVGPPAGSPVQNERFPSEERRFPDEVTRPLREWHHRLGIPPVEMEKTASGRCIARVAAAAELACTLGTGVVDAVYAYREALNQITAKSEDMDLDASYARFPVKALRLAMLFAALEHDGRIELRHWVRAQTVAEHWRADLHAIVAQLNDPGPSAAEQQEDALAGIVRRLCREGPDPTANDVRRYARGVGVAEAARVLDGLVAAGVLERSDTARGAKRYRPSRGETP